MRHTIIIRSKAEHEAYNIQTFRVHKQKDVHCIKKKGVPSAVGFPHCAGSGGCALHTILKIITERLGTEGRQGTYQADGRRR